MGSRWDDLEVPQQIELLAYEGIRQYEEEHMAALMGGVRLK